MAHCVVKLKPQRIRDQVCLPVHARRRRRLDCRCFIAGHHRRAPAPPGGAQSCGKKIVTPIATDSLRDSPGLRTSGPPAPWCGHLRTSGPPGPQPHFKISGPPTWPTPGPCWRSRSGALDPSWGARPDSVASNLFGAHCLGLPLLVHSCSSLLFVFHPSSYSSLPCPSLPVLMWSVARHEYLQQKTCLQASFLGACGVLVCGGC